MAKNYEKQILDHNDEKFSLMVKKYIDMFFVYQNTNIGRKKCHTGNQLCE